MVSARSERPTGWFKFSTSYYADGKLLLVSLGAETLFVRMLALAGGTSSGGLLTPEQVGLIGHKIRSVPKAIDELLKADLLSVVLKRGAVAPEIELECSACDGLTRHQCTANAPQTHGESAADAPQKHVECAWCASQMHHECTANAALVHGYRINAYRRWNQSLDETPAQGRKSNDDGQDAHARPPARERKTERKTETVTSRPASPDGRDVTDPARDAPRSAGGAAQRTPDSGPGKFAGPVRVQPDFAGPRRVADSSTADTVAAKVDARAKLEQFIRQFPQHGNSSNVNGQDPILAWDAVKESDGGDTE